MFEIDFREILTVGMVLFAVIDIVGSIPIIVDLRTKHGLSLIHISEPTRPY